MIGRMARYRSSGDPQELAKQAETGVLPVFEAQPGFRGYSLAADGSDILSLSVWDSRAEAEAGSAVVADWVAGNMSEQIELLDLRYVEILLSTTLGISTTAGATA